MQIKSQGLKWAVAVLSVTLLAHCAKREPDEAFGEGLSTTPREVSKPTVSSAAPSGPTPAPTPSLIANKAARLEECRTKLKAAIPLDLITNMSFDNGRPKLWVGPTWHKIDITAKEGLAREAACFFLAGDETKAITFPIYDGMTGKEIAEWKFTKLAVH